MTHSPRLSNLSDDDLAAYTARVDAAMTTMRTTTMTPIRRFRSLLYGICAGPIKRRSQSCWNGLSH